MKVAIAADHAGYDLKQSLIAYLNKQGHQVTDLGTDTSDLPSDYPDFALKLSEPVLSGEVERGILIDGTGVGSCITANKIQGIYACVCHDTYSARQGVEHHNLNVICLGARVIGTELAREVVRAFLNAKFSAEERHQRRVTRTEMIERSKPHLAQK